MIIYGALDVFVAFNQKWKRDNVFLLIRSHLFKMIGPADKYAVQ